MAQSILLRGRSGPFMHAYRFANKGSKRCCWQADHLLQRRHFIFGGASIASGSSVSAVLASQGADVTQADRLVQLQQAAWNGKVGIFNSYRNPPTVVTAPGRIIAVGDLHGDWEKAVRSLTLAGVLRVNRDKFEWTGGDTVVVQLGDVLDRGTSEIAILMLLRELDRQAREQGGALYMLNGNHESLNVCQNYSYVDVYALAETMAYCKLLEGNEPFGIPELQMLAGELITNVDPSNRMKVKEQFMRFRSALFRPGAPLAVDLASNPTVLLVNNTVFAHGGVLPVHVNYGLDKLNAEVAAWMRAERTPDGAFAAPPFLAMGGSDSVMWTRVLSQERVSMPQRYHACSLLKTALARLGASRLVVGHTPQLSGINSDCDERVWRVDVGMSSGVLDAAVQVLEIAPTGDGAQEVSVLMEGMPLRSYDELDVAVDI